MFACVPEDLAYGSQPELVFESMEPGKNFNANLAWQKRPFASCARYARLAIHWLEVKQVTEGFADEAKRSPVMG